MVHSREGGPAAKTYDDFGTALQEAQRLASQQPGRRFGVMELVECWVVEQPEPHSVRVEHAPQAQSA
jgi:hypothetical protein